jgi:RNA polymerase sigma-70 factor (ECF subfamily)
MVGAVDRIDDVAIASQLAAGDESTFASLIDRHHASMVRLARGFVRSEAVAEEVAQEAWLAVIDGVARFEGRSSLKTWIFRILVRTASARAEKEGRSIPFSALEREDEEAPSVPADRFRDEGRWAGHWASPPQPWESVPEAQLLSAETRRTVERAIDELPPAQKQVITLRDVEGWEPEEVCALLDISEANHRVLLHRARARVRLAVARHLGTEP